MNYNRKALVMLPLAMAVSAAFAADDDYTTLDTSVVSAAGYAQDTREAPASVSVITEKELATKPVTDLAPLSVTFRVWISPPIKWEPLKFLFEGLTPPIR